MNFENLDAEAITITRLLDACMFSEAKTRAHAKVAELRADWGYDGRSESQRSYLRQFNNLRARACRGEMGVVVTG